MNKKLIIINGVMGVGKTTISKKLYKELEDSFWLDGDNCWIMNPFKVTEENKKMVLENITFILNNFISNSNSKYIIFNWVIHTDEIMEDIIKNLKADNVEIYKITLMCSKENLLERILKDIKLGIRDEENIKRSLDKYELYQLMDTIKIDTTNKEVNEIVLKIKDVIS
ncbi:AAA family ATPase [Clostridium thermobutyricum]|uniref:Shikimate kinase n=1 Tax=Clostridium thermobutyricum DSM 4928 TaxID=1121339 RepID=A0A1V4SLF4_9CLOT|nr:AAA family ATPase [Clostridium thermobutyricum]OPX44644.1 shikimate kinase [Clostridium thermobutyricum DSM 4928]